MRSMVAGSAELSRSLFVSRSTDVIGMRHWRDFCINAQKWREKSSTFRQMSKEREQGVFEENMSERGSLQFGGERENVLKDQREGQATKGRLERKRQGVAVKRSSETSEQREERLTAKRKRAAFERSNESNEQREERLAAQRARETSQEKELRLRSGRERAALKRPCPLGRVETNRRSQSRRDSDNRRRNQREAIFAARRNGCTTADGLTLKIAVCITKNGLKKRWQPSIASRKTCATIIVSFSKKHGRCLLPERRYILARDASETESRVDYILLRTTWILEASQQNNKASVKSRNC